MTVHSHIQDVAEPLSGSAEDYDALLETVAHARFVLLGEASHGTHEFYRERARITQRLIAEHGFRAVAVEADWPDAYRVNRFVRGVGRDRDSVDALAGFKRFPQWMWRNADVLDFVGWLRNHNESVAGDSEKCGFYGLDLYSLHTSIEAVLEYLWKIDPAAATRARRHYACFDHFGGSSEIYAWAAGSVAPTCEEEVVSELVSLRQKAAEYLQRDGQVAADALFCAEQNALVIRDAEQYYRTMFRQERLCWNLRDTHMMQSLEALSAHLAKQRAPAKIVVWAHNSHLGDAQATEMESRGELNLGQLARERFGSDAALIGFTTYSGTVTAASDWNAPAERKNIRPALPGSYERVFHETGIPRFWLNLRKHPEVAELMAIEGLERAIGVIYRPNSERASHYFHARLSKQFDGIVHIDHTRAVEPLERSVHWKIGEAQETFPTGI